MIAVSEKFSEKRGRPRAYPEDLIKSMKRSGYLANTTERNLQNALCSSRAYVLLVDAKDVKFDYLIKPKMKNTICTALGRVVRENDLLLLAEKICENRMPTAAAVGYIRRALGTQKKKNSESLEQVIITAINRYCYENQNIPEKDIADALESVRGRLELDK